MNGRVRAAAAWSARLGEESLDPRPHLGDRTLRPHLLHAVDEVLGELAAAVVEDHQEQLVLGTEVAVEGLGGQARLGQDVAHLGLDRALPFDHPVGRLDDAVDLRRTPGRTGRPGPG